MEQPLYHSDFFSSFSSLIIFATIVTKDPRFIGGAWSPRPWGWCCGRWLHITEGLPTFLQGAQSSLSPSESPSNSMPSSVLIKGLQPTMVFIHWVWKLLTSPDVSALTWVCSAVHLYLALWDPVDSSPPGSSVHGIFQARIVEWVAIFYSRLWPRMPLCILMSVCSNLISL